LHTFAISGSWFAMKRSWRKFERSSKKNINLSWSRRFVVISAIRGATASRLSTFTMNRSSGFCLTAKCKRPASNSTLNNRLQLVLERCTIRPWRLDDAESLTKHANNRKVWLALRDLFPYPYTMQDAHEF